MSLEELKEAVESDLLISSRDVDVTIDGDTLKIKEYGNPALEIDDSEGAPEIVSTGEPSVPNQVEYVAKQILGVEMYSCRTYEDQDGTECDITYTPADN